MTDTAARRTEDAPRAAGEVVGDRYELLELVGTGAMGSVFVAQDLVLERVVALKRMHTQRPDDEVTLTRFRNEAKCLARLEHPSLPNVYDFGEELVGPALHPYLVMRFLYGDALSDVLAERGRLEQDETLRLVGALADALHVVHEEGIVHRDLKPGNVMIQPDGVPMLIDFGIATPEDAEPLTQTGEILGTMDYISPEQVSGRRASPSSDIYSLGVVAHLCLTGERPFRRANPVASALAHVNDPAPPLPDDLDPSARRTLESMLAKDPADRPTACEVVRALAV
ncbi:serine/threonine-protein kinase [Nocardioides donggukensis]|uniref:Serine/threonine protein kinase n=1 Tax=Nocardioides donggukensis TaxID=2774019 RepID=A0A927K528_9ACTN|nr:serine/threonine-protein kinase [Nocardioides donggukensis]MBD8870897.1 serine/threonine protein kinase [Nocardioides donggukensis]